MNILPSRCLWAALFVISSFSTTYALDVSVGMTGSGADYEVDGTADELDIQNAIDDVLLAGGGTVMLEAGTYLLDDILEPRNNVHLEGAGIDITILKGTHTFSYLVFNETGSIENFWLRNMTIDADNQDSASGVRFHRAKDVLLQQVKFINITCGGYQAVFGVNDADIAPPNPPASFAWCDDNVIDQCIFDGHSGSLEALLVYNSRNMRIQNCTFQNKAPGCPTDGNLPIVGLWQWTENICLLNNTFQNNNVAEAVYYSNTCTNTLIENCTFTNTGTIRGSNVSDHCTFNVSFPTGLIVRDCNFTGGANDIDKAALDIGGMEQVLVENCSFTEYVVAINFHDGYSFNFPGHGLCEVVNIPQIVAIVNSEITNANNTENLHGIHPGILYSDSSIGNMRHFYICGDIYDTEVFPTGDMIHSFSFIGGGTVDSVFVLGMHLQEDPAGDEFHFEDGTIMGTNHVNEQCDGSGGAPSYCNLCTMADIPSPDVENFIKAYDPAAAVIIRGLLDQETVEFSLPINLVAFSVEKQHHHALLNWESAVEINADRYEIERQVANNAFRKIGEQKANGESNESRFYTYVDKQPESGENRYRLKMIDQDGTWVYSEVKTIIFGEKWLESVQIMPNPVQNYLEIQTLGANESVNYHIYDQLGRSWQSGNWWANTGDFFRLNVEKLPKGMFFLEISTKNESRVLRFYTN